MSVTIAKADGVTVLTLTSDPQSACPPLCQILKGLCCSPMCCPVSQHLKRVQKTSHSVLGTLHIMVGLLNIGLGAILFFSASGFSWEMDQSMFPFWFGGLLILFGIVSILSEKYPSPCLVILNLVLNIAGVAFAIAAIVLYSINLKGIEPWWTCAVAVMLARSLNAVLIVLSVLELFVSISAAILGIKTVRSSEKTENKSTDDPECYKPLLEEVTSNPVV